MLKSLNQDFFEKIDLEPARVKNLSDKINQVIAKELTPAKTWQEISALLSDVPFGIHLKLFNIIYPEWQTHPETAPAWFPGEHEEKSNLASLMKFYHLETVQQFHHWSVTNLESYWQKMIEVIPIHFSKNYNQICNLNDGVESPRWFLGGKLNMGKNCFNANPNATALCYEDENKNIAKMSYQALDELSNQIANSLIALNYQPQDAIAIIMPMNYYAIAIYLGIIKMGGVIVSIADSFSSEEMNVRLEITKTKLIFTQDKIQWAQKTLPLYQKVQSATPIKTIVIGEPSNVRTEDLKWTDFLITDLKFTPTACDPMDICNILFSSGTTAQPKAIPWSHATAIKAAGDAYIHHNIKPGDVLCWPTSLGWMMGPWLIFAALVNKATIALFTGSPKERAFGEFIQKAKVTMLGVVPTLVSSWRQTGCMTGLDWSSIKLFSSTGECSNAPDMLYLMSLANYKPIIEYCGGTEIGGGYITSTVMQNNYPALFNTPAMGTQFVILDETGNPANEGQVALIPPALGLSTKLINADHHEIYYSDFPNLDGAVLRRHGDYLKAYPHGLYSILGRIDDTMNLGGIKVAAAEIERAVKGITDVTEVAAIAVPGTNNLTQLIIFCVNTKPLNKKDVLLMMQHKINQNLNPLFKISDVIFVEELPKTASNKIMRRLLRQNYLNHL